MAAPSAPKPVGIFEGPGCGSPLGSANLGLGYQDARGRTDVSNSPRALHLVLGGCCGSGGVQHIWPQSGLVNRSYKATAANGLGPTFPVLISHDDGLLGTTDAMSQGWSSTAFSKNSSSG